MPVNQKRCLRQWAAGLCLVFAVLLIFPKTALGQEELRMSLASAQAAEYEHRASGPDYYNLAVGPVKARFQAETSFQYNDNVNYTRVNRQGDVIISPGLNADIYWPATPQNTLRLSADFGYIDYLKTTALSHFYVTPDSALVWKMYVGDFVFNLHDRFSLVENVAQSPTVSGTGNFGTTENTSGVGVDWDLYKLIFSFAYNHDMLDSTTSTFNYIDHASELFTLRTAFVFHDTTKVGLDLGGGLTGYDQPLLNDNSDFSLGPFYEARLSPHITAQVSGGYVEYMFAPNRSSSALAVNPFG